MYFLDGVNICTEDYSAIWNTVGFVINAIRIGIPIILIVLGMIDFAKATISNDDKEQQKATKGLIRRFLYAIGVFAVSWIVIVVFDLVANTVNDSNAFSYDEASWKECWNLIRTGSSGGSSNSTSSNNSNSSSNEVDACYACGTRNITYKWGKYASVRNCSKVSDTNANNSQRICENKNSNKENASNGNSGNTQVKPGGNTQMTQ